MGRTLYLGLVLVSVFLGARVVFPAEKRPPDATAALSPSERTALLEAREKVWRAWFTNDRAKLEELLPAETIAGTGGQAGWENREKVLAGSERFAASGAKLVDLQFPGTEIQCYGDVAIVYTTFRFEIETKGKRAANVGKATEIFVKRADRWLNPGWLMASDK